MSQCELQQWDSDQCLFLAAGDFRFFLQAIGPFPRQTKRMVEKSRRDRVGLGLIGLGPSWELTYREPLIRLRNRMTIRLVYDPVEARARSIAAELDAEATGSLRQVLTRHSLQGLLILDPGWCGPGALDLVSRYGKPAFLCTPILRRISTLNQTILDQFAAPDRPGQMSTANHLLMPELGLRFTPASCRLRELIATKLGPTKRVEITCDLTSSAVSTAAIVDWCSDIMGCPPVSSANGAGRTTPNSPIEFEFPPLSITGSTPAAMNRTAKLQQQSDEKTPLQIAIECDRGHATLVSRTRIVWRTASESADESLTDERTEIEILIDQFCRRALGGLNPVGRLSEFVRALEVAKSIRFSNF